MDTRLAAYLELASVPDEEFLERTYRLLLRREPEPEARERSLAKLREGTLSRATLVRELVCGDEFARVRLLDDAVAFSAWARRADERPRLLEAPPGSDERPIEIPWTLARYRGEPRVLDAGYAFAEPAYLAALVAAGARELVGVDLVEAEVPGMRAVAADLRSLPFSRGSFDVAFCISTLEHVGADNRVYGLAEEHDSGGTSAALRELARVLAGDGRLLVTVPCGEPGDHGWFCQDDPRGWDRLFEGAGFFVYEQEVYELGPDGWRSAPEFSAEGVRYGERGPGASAVLCAELRPGRVRQAARRKAGALKRRLTGP